MDKFFSKTLEELRAEFLAHHIGQWFWGNSVSSSSSSSYFPDVFLQQQRRARRPAPVWGKLVGQIANALHTGVVETPSFTSLDLLQQLVPMGVLIESLQPSKEDWTRNLVACLKNFCRSSVEVKMMRLQQGTLLVSLKEGTASNVWVVKDGSGQTLVHSYAVFSWHDALQGLLYLWNGVGTEQAKLDGAQEQARSTLCDLMQQVLAGYRGQQEALFDAAVAVSADGTQIVNADEVFIVGKEQFWRLPCSTFRDAKIMLDASGSVTDTLSLVALLNALSGVRSLVSQFLFHFRDQASCEEKRIFITDVQQCTPEALKAANISVEKG